MFSRLGITAAILFALVFSFQNCGGPTPDDSNAASQQDTVVSQAPFAYDTTVNEISYLSCYGSNTTSASSDPKAYATFRAGAFSASTSQAGVTLNSTFLAYADANFITPYGSGVPKGQAAPSQIKTLLTDSPENKDAQLQLAIRPRGSLSDTVIGGSSSPVQGQDYTNISTALSDDDVATVVSASRGTYVTQLFPGLDNNKVYGTLSFLQSATISDQIRQYLGNDSLLTLTYTGQSGSADYVARFPATETKKTYGKVYGRGYALDFTQGSSSYSLNPRYVMSAITEFNLSVNINQAATDGTWTCDPNWRYKIVQAADRNTQCPTQTGTLTGSALTEYNMIRRHLPADQWDINVAVKCAVPKIGSCYERTSVEYYPTSTAVCGPTQTKDCVHYFSVCVRSAK